MMTTLIVLGVFIVAVLLFIGGFVLGISYMIRGVIRMFNQ